jgi:hypothetical protein
LNSNCTCVNEIKEVVGRAGKETEVVTPAPGGPWGARGALGVGAGDGSRLRGLTVVGGGGTKNEEVRDGDTRAWADVRSVNGRLIIKNKIFQNIH